MLQLCATLLNDLCGGNVKQVELLEGKYYSLNLWLINSYIFHVIKAFIWLGE